MKVVYYMLRIFPTVVLMYMLFSQKNVNDILQHLPVNHGR